MTISMRMPEPQMPLINGWGLNKDIPVSIVLFIYM